MIAKRLILILLVLYLSISLLSFKAEAATVASGTCGTYAKWVLDSTGKLTISGTGNMYEYLNNSRRWYSYRGFPQEVPVFP